MKKKTIKSVLNRKIENWIKSVTDERTREAIKENAIVSGGAITSMLMGEKVNDYDIYFKTSEAAKIVACYYVAIFKKYPPPKAADRVKGVDIGVRVEDFRVRVVVQSAGISSAESANANYNYFEMVPPEEAGEAAFEYVKQIMDKIEPPPTAVDADRKKYQPIFLTSNAITLSDDIQLVIRFTGEIDKIHENYDYTHCKCGYDYAKRDLFIPPEAMECMLNRELRYSTSLYPLCSIIRMRKFLKRGWHINAGQIVKMAWDLNGLDLSDVDVLEDQMIGVDSAYFQEVIDLLRENTEAGKPIDETYLMEVIDRVF